MLLLPAAPLTRAQRAGRRLAQAQRAHVAEPQGAVGRRRHAVAAHVHKHMALVALRAGAREGGRGTRAVRAVRGQRRWGSCWRHRRLCGWRAGAAWRLALPAPRPSRLHNEVVFILLLLIAHVAHPRRAVRHRHPRHPLWQPLHGRLASQPLQLLPLALRAARRVGGERRRRWAQQGVVGPRGVRRAAAGRQRCARSQPASAPGARAPAARPRATPRIGRSAARPAAPRWRAARAAATGQTSPRLQQG